MPVPVPLMDLYKHLHGERREGARLLGRKSKMHRQRRCIFVAPNDILSNLFLEDLEKIWELRKWIPDPCNPHLHLLKPVLEEES